MAHVYSTFGIKCTHNFTPNALSLTPNAELTPNAFNPERTLKFRFNPERKNVTPNALSKSSFLFFMPNALFFTLKSERTFLPHYLKFKVIFIFSVISSYTLYYPNTNFLFHFTHEMIHRIHIYLFHLDY